MDINEAAVAAFWRTCCDEHGIAEDASHHVGPFSDPALAPYQEMLLGLVREGRKRATARVDIEFEKYGIPRRVPGDHWLVTDTAGQSGLPCPNHRRPGLAVLGSAARLRPTRGRGRQHP